MLINFLLVIISLNLFSYALFIFKLFIILSKSYSFFSCISFKYSFLISSLEIKSFIFIIQFNSQISSFFSEIIVLTLEDCDCVIITSFSLMQLANIFIKLDFFFFLLYFYLCQLRK